MAEEQEKELPRLERGNDLSRIFAFTDGVYAIAITLLVLQIEVPTGITDNASLWDGIGDESADLLRFRDQLRRHRHELGRVPTGSCGPSTNTTAD